MATILTLVGESTILCGSREEAEQVMRDHEAMEVLRNLPRNGEGLKYELSIFDWPDDTWSADLTGSSVNVKDPAEAILAAAKEQDDD